MRICLLVLATLFGPVLCLWADVDVVTIPRREGTQLTIYNSEDLTMVREHRLLTLKQGINRIQFSWAETLIMVELSGVEIEPNTIFAGRKRIESILQDSTATTTNTSSISWDFSEDISTFRFDQVVHQQKSILLARLNRPLPTK